MDDAFDASGEFKTFAQCKFGAAGIVAPVVLTNLCRTGDIKLNISLKRAGGELDDTVFTDIKPKVHAFVDGEARDQAVLVIDVGAKRADTVGGVNMMGERPTLALPA